MTQHFFCNAMPIGEIQGDVAIIRFVMESPLEHGGAPVGIDGVFTPHAARAAAEVFNRIASEMEERRANPPPVAVYRKPARQP
ncbi:MAG: hypothetical protein GC155_01995 [Alphaproteobacteria bacterium]|nr:hypothetical protein [Alphaproteobacteria bacterium]